MLKLSNAPEIEIEWGSQTPENRKKNGQIGFLKI